MENPYAKDSVIGQPVDQAYEQGINQMPQGRPSGGDWLNQLAHVLTSLMAMRGGIGEPFKPWKMPFIKPGQKYMPGRETPPGGELAPSMGFGKSATESRQMLNDPATFPRGGGETMAPTTGGNPVEDAFRKVISEWAAANGGTQMPSGPNITQAFENVYRKTPLGVTYQKTPGGETTAIPHEPFAKPLGSEFVELPEPVTDIARQYQRAKGYTDQPPTWSMAEMRQRPDMPNRAPYTGEAQGGSRPHPDAPTDTPVVMGSEATKDILQTGTARQVNYKTPKANNPFKPKQKPSAE